ncbi:MAG: TRAP transporter small permease [Nitrospiraceae bacterium]
MSASLSRFASMLERLSLAIAVIGGIILLTTACIVIISVVGRALFNQPVPGDYEFVQIGLAVSVFSFLPYTQIQNGHVSVDTFTLWLPSRMNRYIDSAWDILLSLVFALFALGLWAEMLDMRRFGGTLMEVPWPLWPIYGVCAVLCGFYTVTAIASTIIKLGVKG